MSHRGGGGRPRDDCPLDCKVYVGELGNNARREELETAFGRFGPLKNVWVARNPPGFAFVMFEHPRDARDAVRNLDGKHLCGRRVKVELSTGKSRHENRDGFRGGGDRYNDRGYGRNGGGGGRGSPNYGPSSRRGAGNGYYSRGSDRGDDDYGRHQRRYSRSRSRSESPVPRSSRRDGHGSGRDSDGSNRRNMSRSPPSPPGRPRSPPPGKQSPRPDMYR